MSDRIRRVGACALAAIAVLATPASAQPPADREPLRVATKEAPPFSYRGADGEWRGVSIEVWRQVAAELEVGWELVEMPVPEMLAALESGTVDAAAAALTLTAAREEALDFSVPLFVSGLGVAVPSTAGLPWVQVLRSLLSREFLQVLVGLLAVLLAAGVAVWLFERRANPEQFGGNAPRGVGSGLWWAAVTMTTVGYGDKAPVTPAGKVVAMIWMFSSLLVIGGFVAAISSTLTLGGIEPPVRTAGDLEGLRVGVVAGTTSEDFASRRLLADRAFPSVEEALGALERAEVDAVVYDRPILRWAASQGDHERIRVLGVELTDELYGLAFPAASPLREPANRALLRMIERGDLAEAKERYLGAAR